MVVPLPHLAVARVTKPHGLNGEALVFVLTDRPNEIFVAGRVLTPMDDEGHAVGTPVTLERARSYHRRWLVKFAGIADRAALEPLRDVTLGVSPETLAPPGPDELYVHEVPGCVVVADGEAVGTAREVYVAPGGQVLAIEREGRETLIPFRRPIVVAVDRVRREITIDPPPGLLEA